MKFLTINKNGEKKEYDYDYKALWVSKEIHRDIKIFCLQTNTTVNNAIKILLEKNGETSSK